MEKSELQRLNDKQLKAVTTDSQYCRVIAGAGSGKTRVLTNRFIYILDELGVYPNQVLAITFTNKAAGEIKKRITKFLPNINPGSLNVFTFHSFCLRFLKREIEAIGIPQNFIIIDEDDQKSIIKRILKTEGLNTKSQIYKELPGYISYQKNLGCYPEDVVIKSYDPKERDKLHFYKLYQEELELSNQLDFDDLLLRTLEILEGYESIRNKWKRFYKHILIDEFQDTNDIQYKIVRYLMDKDTSLYVVGDPDQTIYTWRGANQNILLSMPKTYQNIETVILDENYRSTAPILNAANKLIKHNKGRIEKNLFTENENGTPVVYNDFYDQYTETRYVINTIQNLVSKGDFVYKDIVIMYRANYLTLPFEKLLVQNQIPYQIYGGQKFYQRKEVKDILAFLRLLINDRDNVSFERVINIPKRGIGDASIDKLRDEATRENLTYMEYVSNIDKMDSNIPTKAKTGLKNVVTFINTLKEKMSEQTIDEFLKYLLDATHYKEYLTQTEDNPEDRYENVDTLVSDIVSIMKSNEGITLEQYLENIALMSAQDYVDDVDSLTLMTVHTAKGLEFPVVFLIGLNEGVFPSARAIEDDQDAGLEEERRVCYVAFTRAMERLYVSSFRIGFKGQISGPSCFIDEAGLKDINRHLRENERLNIGTINKYKSEISKPKEVTKTFGKPIILNPSISNNNVTWKIGDRLRHITFGLGTVIGVEATTISVKFDDGNIKKLLGAHASITKITGDGNHEA